VRQLGQADAKRGAIPVPQIRARRTTRARARS
jgi:hypothetical protein